MPSFQKEKRQIRIVLSRKRLIATVVDCWVKQAANMVTFCANKNDEGKALTQRRIGHQSCFKTLEFMSPSFLDRWKRCRNRTLWVLRDSGQPWRSVHETGKAFIRKRRKLEDENSMCAGGAPLHSNEDQQYNSEYNTNGGCSDTGRIPCTEGTNHVTSGMQAWR